MNLRWSRGALAAPKSSCRKNCLPEAIPPRITRADKAQRRSREPDGNHGPACHLPGCRLGNRRGYRRSDYARRRQRAFAQDDTRAAGRKPHENPSQPCRRELYRQLRNRRAGTAFPNVKKSGGDLKLLHLTKKVHDLLQLTKLFTVFDVYSDENTALNSFR